MSSVQQTLLFARTFLKHPLMLGSFIPSSRYLTENLLQRIDWERARVIVEYGPGVGTLTWPMLERMRPDAHLLAIETNADFARHLATSSSDPRLHVVHGSAERVREALQRHGLSAADYVVSGIPYSTMPPERRHQVLRASLATLTYDGVFLVYQFTAAVLPQLREVFPRVRQDMELRNILPARIFHCTR